MFICTKVGQIKTPVAALAAARHSGRQPGLAALRSLARRTPLEADGVARCWESRYLVRAAERSLRRLRTSYVDLLMLHSPSEESFGQHDVASTAEAVLGSGVARYFGISCDTPAVATAALHVDRVSWLEVPFHPAIASRWDPVLSAARTRGVRVLARSPFAGGSTSGLFDRTPDGQRVLNEDVAAGCLRFATSAPGVISVVVGMSTLSHVEQNARLLETARSPRRPDTPSGR